MIPSISSLSSVKSENSFSCESGGSELPQTNAQLTLLYATATNGITGI